MVVPVSVERDALERATKEARRFIKAAEAALRSGEGWGGGQHTAAAKRASMDLTRALVFVRHPRNERP